MTVEPNAAVEFNKPPALFDMSATLDAQDHYQTTTNSNPLFNTSMAFNDFVHYPEQFYGGMKQQAQPPMFNEAMPVAYPFRPIDQSGEFTAMAPSAQIQGVSLLEKTLSTQALVVPDVLLSDVDATMYEPVSLDDCLIVPTDYDMSSPFSSDNSMAEPLTPDSENGHAFVNYYLEKHPEQISNNTQCLSSNDTFGSYNQTATYQPQFPAQQIPLPYEVFSLSNNMFGYSDVLVPAHLEMPYRRLEIQGSSPSELRRYTSSPSESVASETSTPQSGYEGEEAVDLRQQRDDLLVSLRKKGYSYKDVKRLGGFKEAESTLRGRVRVLTKEKSERVRKPTWKAKDITLLRKGVEHFEHTILAGKKKPYRKMPWKQISRWMKDQGGSYLFAPATCARKWAEIKE